MLSQSDFFGLPTLAERYIYEINRTIHKYKCNYCIGIVGLTIETPGNHAIAILC